MTTLNAFLCLLAIHWVADFIFQSDWIAKNKSKSLSALTTHVLVYTSLLAIAVQSLFGTTVEFSAIMWFVGLNAVAHFVTDFVTSRISSKLYAAGQNHEFFVVVGFDQLLHQVTLGLTMAWLLT